MPEKHPRDQHEQNIVSIIGFFCAATGFLLAVSYLYGCYFSITLNYTYCLHFCTCRDVCGNRPDSGGRVRCISTGLFFRSSTRARLLRRFFPLTIAFVLLQNLFSVVLIQSWMSSGNRIWSMPSPVLPPHQFGHQQSYKRNRIVHRSGSEEAKGM